MRNTLLTLILSFFFIASVNAQQKIYSQKEIDSFTIFPTKREKIFEYRDMLLTNENLLGWTYYYAKMSTLHLMEEALDSSYYYANKAIDSYELSSIQREEDEKQLTRAYYNGGRALRVHYKNYNKSLEYLMKALRLINKYPKFSKYLKGYILKDISSNHLEMGDNKLALDYLIQTAKDTNYLKNPNNYGPLYNSIGLMYADLNILDSAGYYYKKAKLDTIIGVRVTSNNNLGDLFNTLGNKDSAFYYYQRAKAITDSVPLKVSEYSRYMSHINYAHILIDDGAYDKSISILNKVLDSINEWNNFNKNDRDLKIRNLNYLIQAYRNSGELQKALTISEQKNSFLTDFHSRELDEKLRDLNIAYEVKEKEDSITKLESITTEQKTIIRQQNIIGVALVILLVAIIGIGVLIIHQRRLRTKYETANLEQRLLRSQLNPHFIFNALQTINILARKESKDTEPYIGKLSSLIRLILKNSREEFVALEDELKSIKDYLELQSNFSQKFKYFIKVDERINQEDIYIPPMFIQPFIENSIEHGIRGVKDGLIEVYINLDTKNTLVCCEIKDNGIGLGKGSKFDQSEKYESFSGKILQERLQIYARSLNKKAKYTILDNEESPGVKVNISLPYVLDN